MTLEKAKAALKQYFGYDEFRPMQESIIEAVLGGKDCMVLMPTGGGKSVCFQVPAVVLDGVAIVVSPLIALMKDQVEGLLANGIRAGYINSSSSGSENQAVEERAMRGELDLLYVSPEKLLSQDFGNLMSHIKVALFAIDEAHCISQWGHDFRPEYTQMRHLKDRFPQVPIIALTATADRLTRKDILEHLGLRDPEVFISSFDRPNLSLAVLPGLRRFKTILDFIKARRGQSGIVYCLSRKSTEELAEKLKAEGIVASFYHAGLPPSVRAKTQEAFIRDDVQIICATIAFGMGIDKPNVRWVIHYNMPKNIESYYQEIGRAGRDGLPADTVLLYSYADMVQLQDFIEEGGQADILRAKLDRMQQYADASVCRRRILLSYFSENLAEDCGNCDICHAPPARVDGTVLAQKALSATLRTQEKAGLNLIIDVLRGSARQEVLLRGFDKLKTYGAGADVSPGDWRQYILQMLNMGLFEVAYDDNNHLHVTPAGREVLFEGRKVELVRPVAAKSKVPTPATSAKAAAPVPAAQSEALFQRLRTLRKQIADAQGVPPYVVFGDATLRDMAERLPVNEFRMRAITGVGEKKFEQYGERFINEVLDFVQSQGLQVPQEVSAPARQKPATPPTNREKNYSLKETYEYYERGMDIEQIAGARGLSVNTIASHIQQIYSENLFPVEITRFIQPEEIEEVLSAARAIGESGLKAIYEAMDGRHPYEKIRFALAYRDRLVKSGA
jgi:ATP-dependent DNA helicase RecQ